ncbi:aromatic prenyltransferase [Byssothecium circinans]|uniref:Aromatic prenyltransferase n=1 Tax=Byssothecium circinans TaxID=147558 RepID=A0A6A5TN40_9PLEO|nr:aromatic prenyltransferase [Byssothecium circinans]
MDKQVLYSYLLLALVKSISFASTLITVPPLILELQHRLRITQRKVSSHNHHHTFEYQTGSALAGEDGHDAVSNLLELLFQSARYPPKLQESAMYFFHHSITPYLGGSLEPGQWQSFMTDDGNPLELSWDWSSGLSAPKIRYSIEPVGAKSGTNKDRWNLVAPKHFREEIIAKIPGASSDWLEHFSREFAVSIPDCNSKEGHCSTLFYAFDIGKNGDMVAKAYFFPRFKAAARNISTWDVITSSIQKAPGYTSQGLQALHFLANFFGQEPDINLEMLAIDLLPPTNSRIKIYFRSQRTDFASVARIMTLNNTIKDRQYMQGIRKLHTLWTAIFESSDSTEESLPEKSHRTAGVLYYVDFRIGDNIPKAKVYIPVRHYAKSDQHILQALTDYLEKDGKKEYLHGYRSVLSETL